MQRQLEQYLIQYEPLLDSNTIIAITEHVQKTDIAPLERSLGYLCLGLAASVVSHDKPDMENFQRYLGFSVLASSRITNASDYWGYYFPVVCAKYFGHHNHLLEFITVGFDNILNRNLQARNYPQFCKALESLAPFFTTSHLDHLVNNIYKHAWYNLLNKDDVRVLCFRFIASNAARFNAEQVARLANTLLDHFENHFELYLNIDEERLTEPPLKMLADFLGKPERDRIYKKVKEKPHDIKNMLLAAQVMHTSILSNDICSNIFLSVQQTLAQEDLEPSVLKVVLLTLLALMPRLNRGEVRLILPDLIKHLLVEVKNTGDLRFKLFQAFLKHLDENQIDSLLEPISKILEPISKIPCQEKNGYRADVIRVLRTWLSPENFQSLLGRNEFLKPRGESETTSSLDGVESEPIFCERNNFESELETTREAAKKIAHPLHPEFGNINILACYRGGTSYTIEHRAVIRLTFFNADDIDQGVYLRFERDVLSQLSLSEVIKTESFRHVDPTLQNRIRCKEAFDRGMANLTDVSWLAFFKNRDLSPFEEASKLDSVYFADLINSACERLSDTQKQALKNLSCVQALNESGLELSAGVSLTVCERQLKLKTDDEVITDLNDLMVRRLANPIEAAQALAQVPLLMNQLSPDAIIQFKKRNAERLEQFFTSATALADKDGCTIKF